MKLRRALLLFAIVLGLAAIASSIARPPDREDDTAGNLDAAGQRAGDATEPVTLRFRADGKFRIRKLEQGRPAVLEVEVDAPGEVEIPRLGLTRPADRLTPARFDVLGEDPGDHRIVLRPASADSEPSRIGTLRIVDGP